jgi:hypothetical protein
MPNASMSGTMRALVALLLGAVYTAAIPILPEDDSSRNLIVPDASGVIAVSAEVEAALTSFVQTTINELRADPCGANETALGAFQVIVRYQRPAKQPSHRTPSLCRDSVSVMLGKHHLRPSLGCRSSG